MKLFRSRDRVAAGQRQKTTASLVQATALYQAARFVEAEVEARAVASRRSWPPRRDAPLARALAAAATSAQGRHIEALTEYDALLLVFRGVFGTEHPQTLTLRSNRAQTLTALSRYAECEKECAAVARAAARGKGPEMPYIAAAAQNGLIYSLNGQGRHQEAEILAREALGAPPPGTGRFELVLRLGLARSLNGQGRHEEALTEAERTAALRSSLSRELQLPEAGAVELAMGSALLGLGRGPEARACASTAHDACLTTFGPDHHRTAEALALIERIDGA
ncbi:tetratricopeptide repeat protein [Actinacidiphila bryophytorum]|uniref:tetratricopeptide repeat protein n=1 Tax=Actinacidiphila bryophytorum TaxID=1436133 RepID=UPI002176C2F6|nr:tetratricopeptide repeat protein [Actinacidiphila bryophytorum]UWE10672.1 tetratricopeptide repeat protein [Actinacidiphila bryophytorum]